MWNTKIGVNARIHSEAFPLLKHSLGNIQYFTQNENQLVHYKYSVRSLKTSGTSKILVLVILLATWTNLLMNLLYRLLCIKIEY